MFPKDIQNKIITLVIPSVIVLLCLFFSCKNRFVKVIATSKSGRPGIVYEYSDKEDTLSYKIKVYYPDGRIQKEATVMDGKYVGKKITYFHNGRIYQVDSLLYPCDKQYFVCDGILTRYNENGSISQEFTVRNGQFNGLSKHYDNNGRLVKTYYLKDDSIKDGDYFEYYSNGNIARKAKFENDTLVGLEFFFQQNGDTLKYYSHVDGQMNFPYKKWLGNGNTLYGVHLKGEAVLWTWQDKDGKVLKRQTILPSTSGYIIPE